MKITLPLPPRELSPNVRAHHMAKYRKADKYRHDAGLAACAAGVPKSCPWGRAEVKVFWFHRTARFPDEDNVSAWLKAGFDGIADAGVVANDRDFTFAPVVIKKDADDPRVEIVVEEIG